MGTLRETLIDNQARDTFDVIQGFEADANPNLIADVLDGNVAIVLNQGGGLIIDSLSVSTSLIPSADSAVDIGENTTPLRWRQLFVDTIGDADQALAFAATTLSLPADMVFTWDSGDVTLTHSAGKLLFGGDGSVELDFNSHEMTNVDINSGAIDGTIIGGTSAAAGTFTTLEATGDLTMSQKLIHGGDTNTYIDFTIDRIKLFAGGIQMLDVKENATQNTYTVGGSAVDIDVDMVDTALFIEGSSGQTTIADAVLTTADINAGTMDGVTIGASSPAPATVTAFTSLGIDDNATSNAMTIDSTERVLIGHTSSVATGFINPALQVQGTGYTESTMNLVRYSADGTGPFIYLGKSRGTSVGDYTIVQNNDQLGQRRWLGADGSNLGSAGVREIVFVEGTPSAGNIPGRIRWDVFRDGGTWDTALSIANSGAIGVNDDNPDNEGTICLRIDQDDNDDIIFALASTDVAHGLTSEAQTDTYYAIQKRAGQHGGATQIVLREDTANQVVSELRAIGGQASTVKTTAVRSAVETYIAEHDGANSLSNVTADGAIWGVRARVGGSDLTRMMLDEDGELFLVSTTLTALDDWDDKALVETYDQLLSPGKAIKDDFARWATNKYNEQHLIDAGILGAPIAEGGLTCFTQLVRLHNGTLRQLARQCRKLETKLARLESGSR